MAEKLPDAIVRFLHNYDSIMRKLPPDGQKQTSRYFEIDSEHSQIINKLTMKNTKKLESTDGQRLKKMLINSLDLADRKNGISEHLMEMVNKNIFKLKMNIKDIEMTSVYQNKKSLRTSHRILKWVPNYEIRDSNSISNVSNIDDSNKLLLINKTKITNTLKQNDKFNTSSKINTIQTKTISMNTDINQNVKNSSRIKKQKTKHSKSRITISESSSSDTDVQPTYCICEEISYGDMVCCDNDLCPIEWFHFGCVSLSRKPKGKWYCPRCRGTSSKIMKPREVFFKELEEYNKRKEEDW